MEIFRPHIIFSAAITLDGKLATRTGDSKLSSKADKNRVYKLRTKVDAILIGKNTAKLDDPLLSVHHAKKNNPIRVVLDSNATIQNNSRILRTSSKIPTIIVVTQKAHKKNPQPIGIAMIIPCCNEIHQNCESSHKCTHAVPLPGHPNSPKRQ